MTLAELFAALTRNGSRLVWNNGEIRISGPRTPEMDESVSQHQNTLRNALEQRTEALPVDLEEESKSERAAIVAEGRKRWSQRELPGLDLTFPPDGPYRDGR